MADLDTVLVKPSTTYLEGSEMKNEGSKPYRVSRSCGLELQAQGFATIVEAQPVASEPAPAAETPAEPDKPKRRGRPPRGR